MVKRTNEEWLAALQQSGETQAEALSDLREYLVRAAFVYLRDGRPELNHFSTDALYELSEDFAQNALINIRQNLEKFRGDAKFTTWVYRFVINEAAAELRKRRYQDSSWDDLVDQDTPLFASIMAIDDQADPELTAVRLEFFNLMETIIENELNERQRVAIIGVHFQGRSMQEVADYLETTPNTLYKMLHDARKKIKAALLARHYGAGDVLGLFDNMW